MNRGDIWWADSVWQSDTLTRVLESVLVVPLTTNMDRARLAGTAII